MIDGKALRGFLAAQRASTRRPCPPGTLYCFKCREPRQPDPASVVFELSDTLAGNIRALCGTCETRMFQRSSVSKLDAKLPGLAIRVVKVPPHIAE